MKKINLREALNKIDLSTDNRYDLRNIYDSANITIEEKKGLAKLINNGASAKVLYENLDSIYNGNGLIDKRQTLNESVDRDATPLSQAFKNGYIFIVGDARTCDISEFDEYLSDLHSDEEDLEEDIDPKYYSKHFYLDEEQVKQIIDNIANKYYDITVTDYHKTNQFKDEYNLTEDDIREILSKLSLNDYSYNLNSKKFKDRILTIFISGKPFELSSGAVISDMLIYAKVDTTPNGTICCVSIHPTNKDEEHPYTEGKEEPTCENCGTRLTDGGYCPKCDDGEEDYEDLEEAIQPKTSKGLFIDLLNGFKEIAIMNNASEDVLELIDSHLQQSALEEGLYTDLQGVLGEVGVKYSDDDLEYIWEISQDDPVIANYNGDYDAWKRDTLSYMSENELEESYQDEWYKDWDESDIELHKSIDWKDRNYRDYPVEGTEFIHDVDFYGDDGHKKLKDVEFVKYLRANGIFPPYYGPKDRDAIPGVGTMYDGHKHSDGYGIHDRTESQSIYDMLSESKQYVGFKPLKGQDDAWITEDDMYMITQNGFGRYRVSKYDPKQSSEVDTYEKIAFSPFFKTSNGAKHWVNNTFYNDKEKYL